MPPAFGSHDYEDKLVLSSGASAALEIPYIGSPQPSVTWKYKGGKLPDSRRFKEDTIYGMTSLTMAKVTKSDAGDYQLVLENPFGKVTFSIKLVILGMYKKNTCFLHTQNISN